MCLTKLVYKSNHNELGVISFDLSLAFCDHCCKIKIFIDANEWCMVLFKIFDYFKLFFIPCCLCQHALISCRRTNERLNVYHSSRWYQINELM